MTTTKKIHSKSRYSTITLEALGQAFPGDIEIGTDLRITPDLEYNCDNEGDHRAKITEYITLRFGYWSQMDIATISDAFGILEESIIVHVYEDIDDCKDRFSYWIPTTCHHHYMNFQPTLTAKL